MAAVIHHGGAGTVAAGLRAGKPTMVCPFFGDQFFWAQMMTNASVGPRPCPITDLTEDILHDSLVELRSARMRAHAERMAQRFEKEDGVAGGECLFTNLFTYITSSYACNTFTLTLKIAQNKQSTGLESFYRHLPVEDMVCDVSVFMPSSTRIARYYSEELRMKLCPEVARVVNQYLAQGDATRLQQLTESLHDYRFVDWGVIGPRNFHEGIVQGVSSAAHEITGALTGLFLSPVEDAKAGAENGGGVVGGIVGGLFGTARGIVDLVRRPIRGGVIMVDKISCGMANKRNCDAIGMGRDGQQSSIHNKPKPRLLREAWLDLKKSFHQGAASLGENSTTIQTTLEKLGIEETTDPQQMYKRLLINHTSLETKEEIVLAFNMARQAREAFSAISQGGDTIEKSEVALVVRQMSNSRSLTARQTEAVITQLDLSGEGHVNFAEFGAFYKNLQTLLSHRATVDHDDDEAVEQSNDSNGNEDENEEAEDDNTDDNV
jgi:hypothetical protein